MNKRGNTVEHDHNGEGRRRTSSRQRRLLAVVLAAAAAAAPATAWGQSDKSDDPLLRLVPAAFDYKKKRGRREWLRARLSTQPDGTLGAEKLARDGAGILSSAVFADGLIELPEDLTTLSAGTMVDFLPFNEMYR